MRVRRADLFVQAAALVCWITGSVFLQAQDSSQPADMIFSNGKILTVDKDFSIAQAIAIRGNKVAAVGTNEQVMKLSGPATKVFDLKGRTVTPGLVNTHVHLNDEGETNYGGLIGFDKLHAYPIVWSGVNSVDDVLNQIQVIMDKYKFKPGEWIYFASKGTGMSPEGAEIMLGGLTRKDIDKVTPNNPIAMGMNWPNDNGVLVNSKAIDFLWSKYGAFIKKYGRYWLDASGQPDGHLESPANRLPMEYLPKPEPADIALIYKKAAEELNSEGVTAISIQFPDYAVRGIQYLESKGEWTNLRFGYGLASYFGNVEDLRKEEAKLKQLGKQMGTGSDMFWVTSASPSAIDGSGSRVCSAQARQGTVGDVDKYWPVGQCSMDTEYNGGGKAAKISGNYFKEWIETGARDGYRLANVHAAGDRSVKLTLNLVEELQRQMGPAAGKGWALDHCRMVDPADIPRAARLGVNFSCSASLGSDSEAAGFGEHIAETFPTPVKTMFKNGVTVSLDGGSFDTLYTLVTRKDRKGRVWNPAERLTRAEALQMATRNGANYMMKVNQFGSLEPGKFADLVVIDKDYMTIPEEEIKTIAPQLTVVNGKLIWAHPAFASEYNLQSTPGILVATQEELKARRKPSGISRR
jgi:predicted amidohydrolase YtcJ